MNRYDIRMIQWYGGRRWCVFYQPTGKAYAACVFTARADANTREACIDWLRTMQHQQVMPKEIEVRP